MAAARTRLGIIGTLAIAATLLAGVPGVPAVSAPAVTEPYRADTVLVRFRDGATVAQRASARAAVQATGTRRIAPNAPRVEVVTLPKGADVAAAIARLKADPSVVYAEPDYAVHELATSDDPLYTDPNSWGMWGDTSSPANQYGSQAAEAWASGYTGSANVYVGVIDEGQQWSHEDLAGNEWVNAAENGAGEPNGKDDDLNGYIDDVHGWDFYYRDNSTYDGTTDDHGTHVSGTIGAVGGNATGVAGVNWNVKIIPAKFLGPNGGYTSDAVSALYYLADLKSRKNINLIATSNSWGGGGFSQTLLDAINYAGNAGMLFIVAAGNSKANIDSSPSYPASYVCQTTWGDCLISVAAIDSSGALASFSNYGAKSVDIGAPGVNVLSTLPDNTYGVYSGTSMATPHVSGAAALCASIWMSKQTSATPPAAYWLRQWLLDGTPTASLSGKTVTGDRLDAGKFTTLCSGSSYANPPAFYAVTATISGKGSVTFSGTGVVTESCSTTCTKSYVTGTTVTLTAKAGAGQRFKGWTGDCAFAGLNATCTLSSLSAAKSVIATFGK